MVVTKEEAIELFADNPFKVQLLSNKVADGTRTTVYKCGDLVDLCRGPHLAHTGKVKAFATTRHSATNWLGDTDNDSLQRMYAISFPDKKQLKVWQENMEKVGDVPSFRADCKGTRMKNLSNLILGQIMTTLFHSADSTEFLCMVQLYPFNFKQLISLFLLCTSFIGQGT